MVEPSRKSLFSNTVGEVVSKSGLFFIYLILKINKNFAFWFSEIDSIHFFPSYSNSLSVYQRPYSAISPKSELFKHSYITNYLFLGGLSLIDLDLLARKMTILVKWTAHPMIESPSDIIYQWKECLSFNVRVKLPGSFSLGVLAS